MALSPYTIMEINSAATAGNLNGGGFNPNNANMLTDLTTDAGTGNTASPVVSSASYSFVAGDVGNWVYVKSGANWVVGWAKIASVSGGKATLDAAIGKLIIQDYTKANPCYAFVTNTVAGIATVGTPTGGVFAVDYSQSTAAALTTLDVTSTAASTTIGSITGGFTPVMVGNLLSLRSLVGTGAINGWYEIVSYTSANAVVLDRTPTDGTNAITAGQVRVAGAMSLNSLLDDSLLEIATATQDVSSMRYCIKAGNYLFGQTISISVGAGTSRNPIVFEGYNLRRGDAPRGANRPFISAGAAVVTFNANWDIYHLNLVTASSSGVTLGVNSKAINCKFLNNSTSGAGRPGVSANSDSFMFDCEMISYRGQACLSGNAGNEMVGCYAHDSAQGVQSTLTSGNHQSIVNCVVANNRAAAIETTAALSSGLFVCGNTLYGSENTTGTGVSLFAGSTDIRLLNNIIYGFVSGVTHGSPNQTVGFDMYNDYFNNDADVSGWEKGQGTIAVNPQFAGVSQLTGTSATSLTNVLTDATQNFSAVVDGIDHILIISGTGTGFVITQIMGIVSHTTTTLTLTSILTTAGAGSAINYQITLGNNFQTGANLDNTGYPGTIGNLTLGYNTIGAAPQQRTSGGGGSRSYTFG